MGQYTSPTILKGHLILLAEDEPLIAFDMEEILRRAGADVVVATDLATAILAASRSEVTVAVLDYRLGQETIEPVCERLGSRAVPFILTTGDGGASLVGSAALMKPVDGTQLIAALVNAIAKHQTSEQLGQARQTPAAKLV